MQEKDQPIDSRQGLVDVLDGDLVALVSLLKQLGPLLEQSHDLRDTDNS